MIQLVRSNDINGSITMVLFRVNPKKMERPGGWPGRHRGLPAGRCGDPRLRLLQSEVLCWLRLVLFKQASDRTPGLPRCTDFGQEPAVETVPAGYFPCRHQQYGDGKQYRVRARRSRQHESNVHSGAEKGGDGGECSEYQSDPDEHFT